MDPMSEKDERAIASTRTLDLLVAGLVFIFGALVVYDSWRIGARWGDDGPQSGYFPFYVGLFICGSSVVTFIRSLGDRRAAGRPFVTIGQLRMVLSMLIPTAIYVALIRYLGIYVASTLFIGLFMAWLGKYGWFKTILVSVGVNVVFFLLFEVWFLVPLPKGPLEAALGLN
jgi:putative tricarboxylic transport membrane protein